MLINFSIFLHFTYFLTFDYLAEVLKGYLLLIIFSCYSICIFRKIQEDPNELKLFFKFSFNLMILTIIGALAYLNWSEDLFIKKPSIREGLRLLGVFIAFLSILLNKNEISEKMIKFFIVLTILTAFMATIFYEDVIIGGITRNYPFSTGIHSSAYSISLILILLIHFKKYSQISNIIFYLLILICIYLISGYKVRSSIFLILIFIFIELVFKKFPNKFYLFLLFNFLIFISILIFFYFFDQNKDFYIYVNEVSSGRVFNLYERIQDFFTRDLVSMIIGTGPGTDLIFTEVWWWSEKDSHSDIFKFMWEFGIFGLICLLWWFRMIINLSSVLFSTILAVYSISLISNGLMTRPSISFLVFIIIALQYKKIYMKEKLCKS